jgi:hypothetical protein
MWAKISFAGYKNIMRESFKKTAGCLYHQPALSQRLPRVRSDCRALSLFNYRIIEVDFLFLVDKKWIMTPVFCQQFVQVSSYSFSAYALHVEVVVNAILGLRAIVYDKIVDNCLNKFIHKPFPFFLGSFMVVKTPVSDVVIFFHDFLSIVKVL